MLVVFGSWAEASRTIKIGVLLGFTGSYKDSHIHTYRAIQLAVDELNEKNGILKTKVELVKLDNKSSLLGSRQAAKNAAQKDIIAVIGAIRSSNSIAIAPIFQDARVIMISPTSTNPEVTLLGDYIFRTCYTDLIQGLVLANFAFDELSLKNVVVLTNAGNKYCMDLARYFIDHFKAKGGQLLWEEDYLDKITDFDLLMKKVKKLNPEMIFIPGYSKDSGLIVKKGRELGISSTFIGGDGWDELIYNYAGNAINGCFHTAFWHPELPGKKNQAFVKNYQKKYGKIKRFDSASAYDAVMIFALAVEKAGCLDPEKIKQAMYSIDNYDGASGTIKFNKNGDPIKPVIILKYINNNSFYLKSVLP